MQKVAVVLGGGGFVGHHLARRLAKTGYTVQTVDLPHAEWPADIQTDLTYYNEVAYVMRQCKPQEVYQLATDMGGAGYIFTGEHDAEVMTTGALINLNTLKACVAHKVEKVFFPSSACVYNADLQVFTDNRHLREPDAYPANPDSEYGWEKLFAERLYLAYARNHPSLQVRIARFHSIVGPECTWQGGREKVFAALCRKIAETPDGGEIRMWGDGNQTRTFLHIEDCLDGIQALMAGKASGPFNLGSVELISINDLAAAIMTYAGKTLTIVHEDGPLGVRGRCSDNTAIMRATGWKGQQRWIAPCVRDVYSWVATQVAEAKDDGA